MVRIAELFITNGFILSDIIFIHSFMLSHTPFLIRPAKTAWFKTNAQEVYSHFFYSVNAC